MNHLNQDVLYDNANSPIGSGFIINKIVNYFQILFCFHFLLTQKNSILIFTKYIEKLYIEKYHHFISTFHFEKTQHFDVLFCIFLT
jgi:hypothetical protein